MTRVVTATSAAAMIHRRLASHLLRMAGRLPAQPAARPVPRIMPTAPSYPSVAIEHGPS